MVAKSELNARFEQFESALERLKKAVAISNPDTIVRDAVIQRFEFSYELLWKLLRKIAKDEQIDCASPKKSFNAGFKLGFIADEAVFLEIIDARNRTVHTYSENVAQEIYEFIRTKVVSVFDTVKENIKNAL